MSGIRRQSALAAVGLLVLACSGAPNYEGRTPAPPDHPRWPPPQPTAAWEPPQTPYPDVTFEDAGVNPFRDPIRDPYSTFAMDVDTASYGVARRFIEDGNLPPRDAVRLEEFVNAFDYGYRAPLEEAFAVHVDGGPTPFAGRETLWLRIGIQAHVIADAERRPASLTFVIDTSGSMQMEDRLDLVKEALRVLVAGLGADDSVAIVEFGTEARVVLNPTSAAEPEVILDAIAALHADGSTNAQAGLELGYDVALRGHRRGAIDRVVLASDGVANVGLTDADRILRRIDREVEAGIDLVAIGVGMGNFNDALLEQLANRGNGFYAYINDRRDAERLFGERLTSTLQTVARDAKVQVEFRPQAVSRYRLLGYENRAIADEDFRDPHVDAGEVGAGHSVTALYEIEPLDLRGSDGFLGTVRLRWTDPDARDGLFLPAGEHELAADVEMFAFYPDWLEADPGFQLAATVGGFAEILRDSPYARGYTLDDVAVEADHLARAFDGRSDVAEFSQLASRAARIGLR